MMYAFEDACTVEKRSLHILAPFIEARAFGGKYIVTDKGRLSRELQKTYGDAMFNGADGALYAVELKAESENRWGNLFLETWSNCSRLTPGWMQTLRADLLFYHFVDDDELYVISLPRLQDWFYRQRGKDGHPNIDRFSERVQGKRVQMNDTWGRCVPIEILRRELGRYFQEYKPLTIQQAAA